MAFDPPRCGWRHADLPFRDVDGLGARTDVPLQRRLPADCRRKARLGDWKSLGQGWGRNLARHRPQNCSRALNRQSDMGRGPAALPRASGLCRGNLSHVFLFTARRRRGPQRRNVMRRRRSDGKSDRRAPARDAARFGQSAGGGICPLRGDGFAGTMSRGAASRLAFRSRLPGGVRRQTRRAGRCAWFGAKQPRGSPSHRARRRRPPMGT